jgi:hypothetical protein
MRTRVQVDWTPAKGDKVEVWRNERGSSEGGFEILECKATGDAALFRYTVRRKRDGLVLEDVTYPMLTYPPEEKVRRALPQVIAQCGPTPGDFLEGAGAYEVKSVEMYDGTPRVMVNFHLKPGVVPSVEKARVWNDFFSRLNEEFEFSIGDVGSWIQFSVKEERSSLRAAS